MRIRVLGGQALTGEYRPSGNTNAAAACLAAALLTDQPVTLGNLPDTLTVRTLLDLTAWLGAQPSGGAHGAPLELITDTVRQRSLTPEHTGGLVGGMLFAAPILARRGVVHIGLDFPLSRIRTHLEALRDLGQSVTTRAGRVEVGAARWERKDILLSQASVTATGLVLMLAAALGRETTLRNAACEPHVQALAHLLNGMGARIDGIGSNVLTVVGTPQFTGAHVKLPTDHIEAASAAAILALTGGRGAVSGVNRADLRGIARVYRRLGVTLDLDEHEGVFVPRQESLDVPQAEEDADTPVESAPWPGFPSDLLPMAALMATQVRGTTLIHERMFANRLLFIDKLKGMGAQIVLCDPHRALVMGRTPLLPTYLDTPDVRVGLTLLAAALMAKGETVIDDAEALTQTFANVFDKLRGLGAVIEEVGA
jgi:UDP-N-acetylglucosamine 1-carboxyvinyltransferase